MGGQQSTRRIRDFIRPAAVLQACKSVLCQGLHGSIGRWPGKYPLLRVFRIDSGKMGHGKGEGLLAVYTGEFIYVHQFLVSHGFQYRIAGHTR